MQNECMTSHEVWQPLPILGSRKMKFWIAMTTNKMIQDTLHGIWNQLDVNLKYLLEVK